MTQCYHIKSSKNLTLAIVCITLSLAQGAVQAATSVTQREVTWHFADNETVGQYANGDWWVVGPVTITRITPESNSGGWIQHGTELNPATTTGGRGQGFDSSMPEGSQGPGWNPALNRDPGYTGSNLVVTTGTVAKAISRSDTPSQRGAGSRPQLQGIEYLTIVASPPASGSFRPPPTETDKTSYWNKADLDYSILSNHAILPGAPALSTAEDWTLRPWPSFMTDNQGRWIHPLDNMPNYGRDLGRQLGNAGMVLHSDYSAAEKEQLYIQLVQIGIDTHATVSDGAIFTGFGGINCGWKWPVVLAGLALNDADIKASAASFSFSFDRQTWYVDQSDVGRTLYTADARPREEYIQSDVGKAEWGEQHWKQPNRDGRNWNAYYRSIALAGEFGGLLSALWTTGGREAWNWEASFDYFDRAYIEQYRSRAGTNCPNCVSTWEAAMYDAYRNAAPPVNEATTLTRHGITWTFDQAYPVGQYANGDPWVVGPVTITSISPTPAVGRNGTVINPIRGRTQGFDNRLSDYWSHPYDEDLNVGNDLPLAVAADSSVVSSISNPSDVQWGQIDTIAILTVVQSAPAADSFRPGYIGDGSRASNWALADVDYAKLAALPRTGLSPPTLASLEDRFDKVWYEQELSWTGRELHMPHQADDGYGKKMAIATGDAALSLNLDYTHAEKTPLLASIIQYGIDIHYILLDGGSWGADGGHNCGRLAPYMIAATVLDDSGMQAFLDGSSLKFQEYQQTFFVSQADVDQARYTDDGRPRLPYTVTDIGMPEWGMKHTSEPRRDGNNWNAYYRDIAGGQLTAPAMAARVMGIRELCNWEPFFLYQERHLDYEQSPAYGGEFNSNRTPGFHQRFYTAFKSLGQPPIDDSIAPTCTLTAPSNGATLMGEVQLTATAADDAEGSGLASVVFRLNGNPIGTATSNDGSTYTLLFNTNSVANHTYTLQAVATDAQGNQGVSQLISITTDNPLPDLSDGLLAYWDFNDNSGSTAADLSGNNNDAIIQGAMWTADAQEGSALDFDGTDGYVDAGNLDIAGNAMTIALWMQSDDLVNGSPTYRDARIISKATGTGEQDHYWMVSTYAGGLGTTVRFRLKTEGTTSTLIADNGNLVNDQWYHIAAVYDGAQMRLYQDGVDIGQLAKSGNLSTDNTVAAWIGRNPDGARPFDGRIDDVLIYNRALSASDILALANGAGLGGSGETYDNFQTAYDIGAPDEDDDGDQLPNLFEYFAGLDPTEPNSMNTVLWMEADAATASFNFMSPVNSSADLVVEIQKSTDMTTWETIATRNGNDPWPTNAGLTMTPMDAGMEQVQVSESMDNNSRSFYRLRLQEMGQ